MAIEGTMTGGQVVLDAPGSFPEGTRVQVTPAPEPYDREAELAILRESLADVAAGRGTDARQFLKDWALERGLPLESGE